MLALLANLWKQAHLERYVLVLLGKYHIYQMHIVIIDICLLLNLKNVCLLIGVSYANKQDYIYARNSLNDATINQIILKTPSVFNFRCCKWVQRFLIQNSPGTLLGLDTRPCFDDLSDLQVKTLIYAVINIVSVNLFPRWWSKAGPGTAK